MLDQQIICYEEQGTFGRVSDEWQQLLKFLDMAIRCAQIQSVPGDVEAISI